MTNVARIRIKRTRGRLADSSIASDLTFGELAYSDAEQTLYAGSGSNSPVAVGRSEAVSFTESLTSKRYAASIVLSALRVVTVDNGYLRYSELIDTAIFGLTLEAAVIGAYPKILHLGNYSDNSWNWIQDYIFLAGNGLLTQVFPNEGNVIIVGKAVDSKTICVNPEILMR